MDPDRKQDLDASQEPKPVPDVEPDPEVDGNAVAALGSGLELVARPFRELSRDELYDLLRLRAEVFVVEQQCPYLDPDGRDPEATHLMVRPAGPGASGPGHPLLACARWYPEGESVHLGRVATAPEARGRGLGRRLVQEALDRIAAEHPGRPVVIHAQAHLRAFYEGFGFRVTGEPFDEDGIEHVGMVKPPQGP